jgi:hypothetical protein
MGLGFKKYEKTWVSKYHVSYISNLPVFKGGFHILVFKIFTYIISKFGLSVV